MALTNREIAILGMLLCCVPLQLWLSKLSTLSFEDKTMRINTILIENKLRFQTLLSPSLWIIWLKELYGGIFSKDYSHWYFDDGDPLGECPAVEVFKYRYPQGHFATSVYPRKHRPPEIKFRVGQVVRHKKHDYIGVVIGWDTSCKAPDSWMQLNHGKNNHWRHQPNYAILVDIRIRPTPQITYVAEENMEVNPAIKLEVHHPDLKHYFDMYDGEQYIPQPWLKALYPMD